MGTKEQKIKEFVNELLMECGNNLSSRTVARQVLSAQLGLTSVFGMRTGGSLALSSPQWLYNCKTTDNIQIKSFED